MKQDKFSIKEKFGFLGYFLKVLIVHVKKYRTAEKLGYYKSIDDIPIYNWDKIEQGEFKYLFINKQGEIPEYFNSIINDMFFQFENVNMDMIEKKHKLAYLGNLYATSKKVSFLNKYRHLEAEIKKEENTPIKRSTLNEKVNYVESVFNSIGSIDVKKMSASRFYSLFHLVIEKAEKTK